MSHRNFLHSRTKSERISKKEIDSIVMKNECKDYPSYVIDNGIFKKDIKCEVNIAILPDTLKPYEECIVTISPKANKPIKQIVSAYVVMDVNNINKYLSFSMIGFRDGDKQFDMQFKNNSEKEHKLKIYYHVLF